MTSEIAVLNKSAVALAADSAVTVGWPGRPKIYNTADKLFALSRTRPVGVMVFGAAEFMGVPWEILLSLYEESRHDRAFPTVREHAEDLVSFVQQTQLYPPAHHKRYLQQAVSNLFHLIRQQVDEEVSRRIGAGTQVTNENLEEIVTSKVVELWDLLSQSEDVVNPEAMRRCLAESQLHDLLEDSQAQVFESLPLSQEATTKLRDASEMFFSKDVFIPEGSGIVVAGFGSEELFPGLVQYELGGLIGDCLKGVARSNYSVSLDSTASIIPFAQSEMVATFITGIDPSVRQTFQSLLTQAHATLLAAASDAQVTKSLDEEARLSFVEHLGKAASSAYHELLSRLDQFLETEKQGPVLDAVTFLPRDELAAMAEALVNLTSFKRKMSLDVETVGGPIDVAVISKDDGFVWIKRKQYFRPELNPEIALRGKAALARAQEG